MPLVDCIAELLYRVPELQSAYYEHLRDFDELLPHVFLGEVTRCVVQQVRSAEIAEALPARRTLDFFEEYMAGGGREVQQLIAVSFVENLAKHDDILATLSTIIGPHLRAELGKHSQ